QELLFYRVDGDAPTGGGVFRDDETAIGLGLDDRVADVGQVGDGLPIDLAVAARALRAALDNVSGDRPGSELVELVRLPAEAMDHRGESERGVGGASGDHHLRAGSERFGEGERADVRVGAEDAIAYRGDRLARVHIAHLVAFAEE